MTSRSSFGRRSPTAPAAAAATGLLVAILLRRVTAAGDPEAPALAPE